MANYYDAFGHPQRPQNHGGRGPVASRPPTLDDYQRLVQTYTQLTQRSARWEEERRQADRTAQAAIQAADERIQGLESELTQAQQSLAECREAKNGEEESWKDRYLRLQAEMENLRKRTEQRYAAQANEQRRRILLDMLPLADHLEMALQHGEGLTDPATVDFLGNIQATQQAFLSALKRYGVEPVQAVGAAFDPSLHEALGHMPSPDVPADHVAVVVQAGYTEGDQLLRPARVMVSAGEWVRSKE